MEGLGSMGDKAKRIEKLSAYIADIIGANTKHHKPSFVQGNVSPENLGW
jgi:glycyl-tRNA synthetase beta subunit